MIDIDTKLAEVRKVLADNAEKIFREELDAAFQRAVQAHDSGTEITDREWAESRADRVMTVVTPAIMPIFADVHDEAIVTITEAMLLGEVAENPYISKGAPKINK